MIPTPSTRKIPSPAAPQDEIEVTDLVFVALGILLAHKGHYQCIHTIVADGGLFHSNAEELDDALPVNGYDTGFLLPAMFLTLAPRRDGGAQVPCEGLEQLAGRRTGPARWSHASQAAEGGVCPDQSGIFGHRRNGHGNRVEEVLARDTGPIDRRFGGNVGLPDSARRRCGA